MAPKARFVNKREAERDDSDDELEELDYSPSYQKDMVLFCIDAGPSMHEVGPKTGTSNLYVSLKAAASLMEKKLVSSHNDHVGIMVFNTSDTIFKSVKQGEYYRGSHELLTVKQVNVPDTYNIKSLLKEAEQDMTHLATVFPPAEKQMRIDWALANAGVGIVTAANAGSKRVFFVTDNDDPHPFATDPKSTRARKSSLEKMSEFRKQGIQVETFFIGSEEKPFNVNKFYADIFEQYDDDDDDAEGGAGSSFKGPRAPRGFHPAAEDLKGQEPRKRRWDSEVRFNELENDVSTRETPKRVTFSIPFMLGTASSETGSGGLRSNTWAISIKGYSLISETEKETPVKVIVDDECGELKEVMTHQHYLDPVTQKKLAKDQIISAFQFGNTSSLRGQVRFESDELKGVRTLGNLPSLRLLGFKDRDELKFQDNVKPSNFIYPSDVERRGSKKVFAGLLNAMLSKNKIGLGLFMPRQNSALCFVAILPQREEVSASGQQVNPPGMHLVTLPFADDVREVPEAVFKEPLESATPEQVDAAKAVVERFQKKQPFNPDHYPNPALNHHYAVLRATAFQEELPEKMVDLTIPNYETIKKRTAHLIEAFHDEIERDARTTIVSKTSSAQRKASFANDSEILKMWKGSKLSSYRVDELKAACEFYRIPTSGKKADLVERLDAHITKRQGGR